MYHAHFRGTHYEAGFRWGSLLLNENPNPPAMLGRLEEDVSGMRK